jgi:hypothetical protein
MQIHPSDRKEAAHSPLADFTIKATYKDAATTCLPRRLVRPDQFAGNLTRTRLAILGFS